MLGVPLVIHEFVIITMHPTFMACIWIRPGTHTQFSIAAYKQYVCTHFQIGRGIIFNPTWVESCITTFLIRYALRNAYICFMPDYTSIVHGFIASDTAYPSASFFKQYQTRHIDFGFDYLYPAEDHQYIHYWYQIPRTLVLQYQCIAIHSLLNCIRITPRFCALLYAYKAIQGSAFRRAQLGMDLIRINNRISHYFNAHIIRRLVTVHDQVLLADKGSMIDIVAACGIAYLHQEALSP
jgi:hypothetical protein